MADPKRDTEQVIQNIRELNERMLDYGRKAGLDYLEAYERTLVTLADYQDKLADSTQGEWLVQVMRVQANFTRDMAGAFADAGRASFTAQK